MSIIIYFFFVLQFAQNIILYFISWRRLQSAADLELTCGFGDVELYGGQPESRRGDDEKKKSEKVSE